MNLKISPSSILNKDKKEMEYIRGVYKRRVQAEIESYKDPKEEDNKDSIRIQDILKQDRISI